MTVIEIVLAVFVILIGLFLLMVIYGHAPFRPKRLLENSTAPEWVKENGKGVFNSVFWKSMKALPADLSAPVVVPFILLFTKWEAEKLAFFDSIWGNDASINGDVRIEGSYNLAPVSLDPENKEAIASCYWVKGHHPRSFYARWVWLGLRNRASALSQSMSVEIDGGLQVWFSENDYDGWNLRPVEGRTSWVVKAARTIDNTTAVSVFAYVPLWSKTFIRVYYGYKIPMRGFAMPATVGWSIRKVK